MLSLHMMRFKKIFRTRRKESETAEGNSKEEDGRWWFLEEVDWKEQREWEYEHSRGTQRGQARRGAWSST